MSPVVLSRSDARRVAVRAQWLHADRPPDLLTALRHITLLQIDPTRAVAASQYLVLWSRLGSAFDPDDLDDALATGTAVELQGTIRPMEDVALYRAEMAAWPGTGTLRPWQEGRRRWVAANEGCRRDILHRLELDGPLPSRAIPDTCEVPWQSSGWTDDKNVTRLLELMVDRGEVAVAGRAGRERLWDLAERVYPDALVPPADEARRLRDTRRLAALGIARSRGPQCAVEPIGVEDAGVEAVVDGVRGTWRVDPALLDVAFAGRAALLSPFDRLLHDRARMADLFEFEYALEMFKPKAARRWGYYALPVLAGDRLVGKLDATADRDAGVLRVDALHWDDAPTPATRRAVDAEVEDLAAWLGLALRRADRRGGGA